MATLAPVLVRHRNQINEQWPTRDKTSDGWIGDAAHQATKSDHNPDARGIVHATDTDRDGIDAAAVVAAFIRHPSTNYVIYNRVIYSRAFGFRPREYTGSNPHTGHVHCSILHGAGPENSPVPLELGRPTKPAPAPPAGVAWHVALIRNAPTLRRGAKGRHVRRLQAVANLHGAKLRVDGDFGAATESAVRAFQRARKLTADGIVGQATRTALLAGSLSVVVNQGDKGTAVGVLQAHLVAFGYAVRVDRDFGPATAKALRLFQTRYGLRADAVAGRLTWTALLTR